MQSHKMWIGGKWIDAESGKTFVVLNPATEEALGQVPLGAKADVDKAVAAAVSAFPLWSKTLQSERAKVLNRIARAIRENAEELVSLEVREHGTPVRVARVLVEMGAEHAEYTASIGRAMMGQVLPASLPNTLSYLQRVPIGVCAVITPWNVPLMMMIAMVTPAIVTGNTCVLKPASINSLIAVKFAQILESVGMPPGVVNLVTGPGGSVGEALASHPGVDLVRFTGSTETGKVILSAASQTASTAVSTAPQPPLMICI